MGSSSFPVSRINSVAAASCLVWSLFTLVVHLVTRAVWPGYSKVLRSSERRQWCNKITCGLHAAVLSAAQARNLFDPVLNADPLHGVTDSHFFWGSVLLGYLVYDTAYSLACFPLRSGAVMLAHHLVGIAGCVIGVFYNKLGLFGMAVEVFFESCNPLLHVLGCMRIAGKAQSPAYGTLSRLFVAQFFLFRVVISNAYFFKLLRIVVGLPEQLWWAWAGVAVFALLNTLNALWLVKLVAMVCRDDQKRRAASRAAESAGAAGGKSDGRPGALSIAADATVSIATLPRAKAD